MFRIISRIFAFEFYFHVVLVVAMVVVVEVVVGGNRHVDIDQNID